MNLTHFLRQLRGRHVSRPHDLESQGLPPDRTIAYQAFGRVPREKNYLIGRGSYGSPTVLDWDEGTHLKIGRFCSIAGDVKIFLGGEHRTRWISTFPFPAFFPHLGNDRVAGFSKGDVIIENDVWIGQGASIMSGVRIASGSAVAAQAMVTKSVAPYSIVAGNPAAVVRQRFSDQDVSRLLALGWWDWESSRIESAMLRLMSGDVDGLLREFGS